MIYQQPGFQKTEVDCKIVDGTFGVQNPIINLLRYEAEKL